ncbi:alpha/beta hydrolase [Azospirillum oleiclasticum]|nr:alpha/beta hydrolase [Azospirillum oleiclasticum]
MVGRTAIAPLLVVVVLAACAATPAERRALARRIATDAGLESRRYTAGAFTLAGWLRRGDRGPLVVVIESDGYAWASRNQPSADPTPRDPMGLRLAVADPAPRLLYLARPCQYADAALDAACPSRLWTSHRFAPEVIDALGSAIDAAKRETGAARVLLGGVSGGGVAAALLAGRREDVDGLITMAAPLDHAAWTAHHGVSPLSGSLDPTVWGDRLRRLPQLHAAGADDSVVPPALVIRFTERVGLPQPMVVSGQGHEDDWTGVWGHLRRTLDAPSR